MLYLVNSAGFPCNYNNSNVKFSSGISNVIPSMKTDPGFTRLCDYKRFDNLTDEEEERLLKYGLQFGPPMLKSECDSSFI